MPKEQSIDLVSNAMPRSKRLYVRQHRYNTVKYVITKLVFFMKYLCFYVQYLKQKNIY